MNDYLKVAVPAFIGLIGTLLAIYFGYRQWKRQRSADRYEKGHQDRQLAYKDLMQQIEDVHIKLRVDQVTRNQFQQMLTGINSFLLKNALYIDQSDQKLVDDYLSHTYRFMKLVAGSGDQQLKQDWAKTAEPSADTLQGAKELQSARTEVERLRNALLKKGKAVVIGDSQ